MAYVVNCILRIKCSLNLLVSYICFDICGGIEKASSRGHRARIQFPQKFCALCDKQELRDSGNFGKTLKIRVKLILNCPRAHAITYTKYSGSSGYENNSNRTHMRVGVFNSNEAMRLRKVVILIQERQRE